MKPNSALITFSIVSNAMLLAYAQQALMLDGSSFYGLLCLMVAMSLNALSIPSFLIPKWMKVVLLIVGALQTAAITVAWSMRPMHPYFITNLFIFGVLLLTLRGCADILELLKED